MVPTHFAEVLVIGFEAVQQRYRRFRDYEYQIRQAYNLPVFADLSDDAAVLSTGELYLDSFHDLLPNPFYHTLKHTVDRRRSKRGSRRIVAPARRSGTRRWGGICARPERCACRPQSGAWMLA